MNHLDELDTLSAHAAHDVRLPLQNGEVAHVG